MTAKSWALKCGTHLIGEVTLTYFENWHNYGTLKPGPGFVHYQELFESYLHYDLLADAAENDEIYDKATDSLDAVQEKIDLLNLLFVDLDSGEVSPIHDFHPGADNEVYWRFSTPKVDKPPETFRDWVGFCMILILLPFAFIYMFASWLVEKFHRLVNSSRKAP